MKIKMKWAVGEEGEVVKKLGEMMESGYRILDGLSMLKLELNERGRGDVRFGMEKVREGCGVFEVVEMIWFEKDGVRIV